MSAEGFWGYLEKSQQELAEIWKIVERYRAMQGTVSTPPPTPAPDGLPRKRMPGETAPLASTPITTEELLALQKGQADAMVVEKFLAEVKAFLKGAMMAGGMLL